MTTDTQDRRIFHPLAAVGLGVGFFLLAAAGYVEGRGSIVKVGVWFGLISLAVLGPAAIHLHEEK